MKLMGVSLVGLSIVSCSVLFVVQTPQAETHHGTSRSAGLVRIVQPARSHASPAQTTQALQFMVAPEYPVGVSRWPSRPAISTGTGKSTSQPAIQTASP